MRLLWLSRSFLEELKSGGKSHFPAPSGDIGGIGLFFVPLEFEQTQDQVSQGCHGLGGISARDLGSIFAQGDVATVMGTAFTGSPVTPDVLSQLPGGGFLRDQAAGIETVFLGLPDDFASTHLLPITPDANELPTPRQAGLLGSDRNALKPPPFQPPMILAPTRIILGGKKTLRAT